MSVQPLPGDGSSPSGLERGWHATREPSGLSRIAPSDSVLLARLSGPAHEADLRLLAAIDLDALSDPHDRVLYLKAVDRVAALVAAMRSDAVVAFAGAEPSSGHIPEKHVAQELSVATRVSSFSAAKQIEAARVLETVFPSFKAALRAGEISPAHTTILVEKTRPVADPAALAAIARVGLPKAKRMTPGEFARECTALVARFDRDAGARARRAVESRRVTVRELDDGLGYLGLVHDWVTICSIHDLVRADGRRLQLARRAAADAADPAGAVLAAAADAALLQGEEDSTADACRADALAARLLGVVGADSEISWDRETPSVEVQVVIDLATLRGEDDSPCLLDGMPVPADLARDIAGYAKAFRRMVTDPIDGHLLDYGRLTYLPDRLRTYVLARDKFCSTPGCMNKAMAHAEMDHAVPFPEGPSNPANTNRRCSHCHQLKTASYVTIHDSRPDGSHTWRSIWGQSVHVPAQPVLPGRDEPEAPPPPPPEPPLPDEIPPF